MALTVELDDMTAALLRRAARKLGRPLLDKLASELLHERLLERLRNEDRFARERARFDATHRHATGPEPRA